MTKQSSLLVRLKAGESRAVEEWFAEYQPRVRRLVSSKISHHQDIEDIVQETFISCLKHLPLFRGDASIWTWMKRIAHHQVADFYRKKYAKKAIHALSLDRLIGEVAIVDAHGVSEKVTRVLREMRDEYRQLLLMKYDEGLSVKELAELWNRTDKSIESDLFRARKQFKELYAIL